MKVDIIPTAGTNADFEVRPREGAPVRYDDGYEGEPLFGPASDCECMDWCEEHGHKFRHRKQAALVPSKFIHDMERVCDDWFDRMCDHASRCGRRLVSDITYRASAAWKENPTHYCYSGDSGGEAYLQLEKTGEELHDPDALIIANKWLDMLFGAAHALYELGFVLTFDKDGKHTVFSASPQWVTLDEDEW